MRSFLVTDFGIAFSRTLLIDIVEGQYRVISGTITRTTVAPPDADVTVGLIHNIEQLQTQTGRPLLGPAGLIRPSQPDGSGFDEFIATASSGGRPLRAVLVGLMDDFSLVSARRALTGTYVEEIQTLSLVDMQTEEERINTILRQHPDVIIVAGGTNDGNEDAVRDLIRLVELAIKLVPHGARPIVLYAGNERLSKWVKARLDDHCVVFTADNIRPTADQETLSSAKLKLAQVFDDFLKRQPGGFQDISDISAAGIVPTAQSAGRLVRYLDALNESSGAMYVDVGSGTSSLLTSWKELTTADIRGILGLGHNVLEVLKVIDWRDVERWLPFRFSLEAYEEWAHNKALAPLTIPQSLRDFFIEAAVGREIVRLMLKEAERTWRAEDILSMPPFSPIIVGGAVFTNVPPGLSALLIMDALQPSGVFDVWLDPYALTPALGALSTLEPVAVVQVIDNGGYARLGTAFCPTGRVRGRRARMKVKIKLPNGQVLQHKVAAGEIWIPHITPGIWVEVEVRLSWGLRLGGKRKVTRRLQTGTAGLIFDLRGRPLALPSGRRLRQAITEWFTAVTGLEVDQAMLEQAEAVSDEMRFMTGTAIGVEDYPVYKKLPNTAPDPAFTALLKGSDEFVPDAAPLFPVGQEAEPESEVDDLARELGLR